MQLKGIPERFWVVTRPTEVSDLADICFSCTVERLMGQARGGLRQSEIVGIYDKEQQAMNVAKTLLGEGIIHADDAVVLEVLVHLMVLPTKDTTAKALADAAVVAVTNAMQHAEQQGFEHPLAAEAKVGFGQAELKISSRCFQVSCIRGRRIDDPAGTSVELKELRDDRRSSRSPNR